MGFKLINFFGIIEENLSSYVFITILGIRAVDNTLML